MYNHGLMLSDAQCLTHDCAGERGHSVAAAAAELVANGTIKASSAGSTSNSTAPSHSNGSASSTAAEQGQQQQLPWLPSELGAAAAPSFIADSFFLTQTWMHAGLMPAYYRLVG